MKKLFFGLFLVLVYSHHLPSGQINKKTDTKLINGVKHVYNTAIPSKGKVILKLKKILTIEPGEGEAKLKTCIFTIMLAIKMETFT